MVTVIQVGKKYIASFEEFDKVSIYQIFECVYISPQGLAILCNSSGTEKYLPKDIWGYWKEYKEPKTGTVWVNIYRDGTYGMPHKTREIADHQVGGNRIACIKVKWTEGQGL